MWFRQATACVCGLLICATAQAQDWTTSGNPGIISGLHWLGTQNNAQLEMRVSGATAFRLLPVNTGGTPHVVGGSIHNVVGPNIFGATIGGGGDNIFGLGPNTVHSTMSTISGGAANTAGTQAFLSWFATVGGGAVNQATGQYSTVAGGEANSASGMHATIAGGHSHAAPGQGAVIAGGDNSNAGGSYSTIGGGSDNVATGDYSSITGGTQNAAVGDYATVAGGNRNKATGNYSLAAGRNATANGVGTFVWADSTTPLSGFTGNGNNQFLVRAIGGFGVNTNQPVAAMHVNGMANNSVAFFAENAYSAIEGVSTAANGNGVIGTCHTGADAWGVNGASVQGQGVVGRSGPVLPGGGFPAETGVVGYTSATGGIGGYFENANPGGLAGRFVGNVCVNGDLVVTGTITPLGVCPSDARFKCNIAPLVDALATIEKLRGVSFDWEQTDFPERSFPDGRQIGVIAQEVRDVLPELVVEGKDGYLSVDYARFAPMLIEAMRELRAENSRQLAERDAQIDELKTRLEKIETLLAAQYLSAE